MEEDYIGCCDMCGERIYFGDAHYNMPDGLLVCGDSDCLEDWAQEYRSEN